MRFEKVSKEAFIKDCMKWSKDLLEHIELYNKLAKCKTEYEAINVYMDGTAGNKFLNLFLKDKKEPDEKELMDLFEDAYEHVSIPVRSTSGSAGYDFKNPFKTFIMDEKVLFIPTGIRVFLDNDKILQIAPRSSASKKGISLANTIGIIDSDYVNADNEGDIIIALKTSAVQIEQDEKIAQGIILPFFTVDDDTAAGERTGGFGSTGK